jgi:hypothetical protein
METTELLDQYYLLCAEEESKQKLYAEELAELVPPEVRETVTKFEAHHKEFMTGLQERKAEVRAEIDRRVLVAGETVKTDRVSAIWIKGRVSWDGKMLDGMAKIDPRLLAARKEGEPTVTIRFAK